VPRESGTDGMNLILQETERHKKRGKGGKKERTEDTGFSHKTTPFSKTSLNGTARKKKKKRGNDNSSNRGCGQKVPNHETAKPFWRLKQRGGKNVLERKRGEAKVI